MARTHAFLIWSFFAHLFFCLELPGRIFRWCCVSSYKWRTSLPPLPRPKHSAWLELRVPAGKPNPNTGGQRSIKWTASRIHDHIPMNYQNIKNTLKSTEVQSNHMISGISTYQCLDVSCILTSLKTGDHTMPALRHLCQPQRHQEAPIPQSRAWQPPAGQLSRDKDPNWSSFLARAMPQYQFVDNYDKVVYIYIYTYQLFVSLSQSQKIKQTSHDPPTCQ